VLWQSRLRQRNLPDADHYTDSDNLYDGDSDNLYDGDSDNLYVDEHNLYDDDACPLHRRHRAVLS
jgi:hypothetical protein